MYMKKYIQSEKGYTLVTVLAILTVLLITGSALAFSVTNSSKFVSYDRESIQATVEAENIMEEGMAHLEREIDLLNNGTLTASNVMSKMNDAIDKAKIAGGGKYQIAHETLKNGDNGIFSKKIEITVPVGDSGKKLTRTIVISTIAEIFQYGLISPSTITFNGAAYIEGDVYANKVYNRNEAKFITSGTTYWKSTSYPAIKGSLSVVDKKGYYYYNNGYKNFTPTTENLNKYFSLTPKIKEADLNVSPLSYDTYKNKLNLNLNTEDLIPSCYYFLGFKICPEGNTKYSSKVTLPKGTEFNGSLTIEKKGDVTVNGNLVINENLTINPGGKLTVNGSIYVNGWAALNGSLTINGENNFIYIHGYNGYYETIIKDFDFAGKMFSYPSVDIRNNFNTNGTVFVKKSVNIEDLVNDGGGTLVIIADGEIRIANNSLYTDEPKEIDAFLYSNQQMEIYGVGSHLQINGGVYGNPVILNVMKGKTKEKVADTKNYDKKGGLYFEKNQDKIPPEKARLSIIYKKDLILNPPTGIPTVDKIQIKELNTSLN